MNTARNWMASLSAIIGLAVLIGLFLPVSNPVQAAAFDEITYKVDGDVYLGDKTKFKNPCILTRKKVFAQIPAIQQIKREGLDKNSARYSFLIEQANKVFRKAVAEAAAEKGYDLVGERGAVKASNGSRIPDITKTVIEKLPGS